MNDYAYARAVIGLVRGGGIMPPKWYAFLFGREQTKRLKADQDPW